MLMPMHEGSDPPAHRAQTTRILAHRCVAPRRVCAVGLSRLRTVRMTATRAVYCLDV